MADESTSAVVPSTEGYKAEDFVAGIPSASILGILAGAGTSVAITVGFLPPVLGAAATAIAVGSLVFVSEMVRVAFTN